MFDIDAIKTLSDYQRSNFYRAKVVSLDDPLALNRIQIRIFGLTDDVDFPDESQPWCEFQFRDGVITYPNVDDIIWIFFEGGDIFRPVYLGTIYSSTNIECEKGWEKFLTHRSAASAPGVEDTETYKQTLKIANGLTNPDDVLISQDNPQQFRNCLLPEDAPFSVKFTGDTEAVINTTPIIVDGEEVDYTVADYPVHPRYAHKMPAHFKKRPAEMYVWYKTENLAAGKTWRNILGGWTFYNAEQLEKGFAVFPDNLRHINYRRYQTWSSALKTSYFNRQPGLPGPASKRDISWEFIPCWPSFFWHPESMEEDSIQYYGSIPFPFGKMNLDSWNYWKQHTILSHDGKSAIELDDNENYERLRIDFNYGAGGIEFSRVGMNGMDAWTDGVLNFYAAGDTNEGAEKVNRVTFNKSDLRVRGGRSIELNAHQNVDVFGGGDTNIVAKRGMVSMMANNGILLGSLAGVFAGAGNIAGGDSDFMGTPVISAPEGTLTSKLNGHFLYLNGHDVDDAGALKWMNYFNAAMGLIKELCNAITKDAAKFGVIGATNTLQTAIAGVIALSEWEAPDTVVSIAKLAGAWSGIKIQGSK